MPAIKQIFANLYFDCQKPALRQQLVVPIAELRLDIPFDSRHDAPMKILFQHRR
jgi:hypothetical protein